jgi:rhodanese-related sulfurtransferase
VGSSKVNEHGLPIGQSLREGYEISCREARQRTGEPGFVIVDVRLESELQVARVEGAIHIPLHEIEQRADEIPAGAKVATLCHHGVRSLKAALALRAMGWADCVSIAGGIEAWSLSADPNVPRYERNGPICRIVT